MYNELFELIMKVDFSQAEEIFIKMSEEEQKQAIENWVYSTESMIFYSFVQYINKKNEKILFHEIQFDMLTNALCHIEGAYQMALYHNQRLLELVPKSVKYMEWMLSFYDIKGLFVKNSGWAYPPIPFQECSCVTYACQGSFAPLCGNP